MPLQYLRFAVPIGLTLLLALVLAASDRDAAATADQQTGRPDQVSLALDPTGDAVARTAGGGYLSPVTEAANPFTHVLVRWEVVEPPGSLVSLAVRASPDNVNWTDWGPVVEDIDLWTPLDGEQVRWSQVIHAGDEARFWQVQATLQPAPDGGLPQLLAIDVSTVDARFGPDDAVLQAEPPLAVTNSQLAAINRPPVVSRTAWGSPDGQSSRVSPAYYPVRHMVVHHTADANSLTGSERSWANRVRAIWSFHTYTRRWGDVGYNFLVAPDGTIFEGRAGGDDAVGFHDAANYGSMGVSVIGTYTNGVPSAAAQQSLVELLAWKAAQKGIDPLGRAYYYGCEISRNCPAPGAIVETIAGHRQTRSGTTCPGNALHALLPELRQRVRNRVDSGGGGAPPTQPDNGDLLIDELESSFARSPANWYAASCGYGGHTYYSFATNNAAQSSNSATWRPNLPAAGRYRVLVHIPRNCDNGPPTGNAVYKINAADRGYEVAINQGTVGDWVDLGVYTFNAGNGGAVELYDLTGEALSDRRVIYFDSVRWVPDTSSDTRVELLNVQFDRTTVAAGEALKVTFTVRNAGNAPIYGQDPQAGTRPDGSFDPANGYVYDEGECFLGEPGQTQRYPVFPKAADRVRLMLGPTNRSVRCDGNSGGYPWRWGIDGVLEPGATRDVVGYVRFREPGSVTLQAGVIQEYVQYHVQNAFVTTINVTNERSAPVPASYDTQLRPLAHVYRLGNMPDNLLARTANPLSILRGEYVGSFAWTGSLQDWGAGGPFGLSDAFLVEQTRTFIAPVTGDYTFRSISDDGSWLWVNGGLVIQNHGLHEARAVTSVVRLNAGVHSLSFRYFERSGLAVAAYDVREPGADGFTPLREGLARQSGGNTAPVQLGSIFAAGPDLALSADDQGGSGVGRIRYSWDGANWFETSESILRLGRLVDGAYHLRYQIIDNAGNATTEQNLLFTIDSRVRIYRAYLPIVDGNIPASDFIFPEPIP